MEEPLTLDKEVGNIEQAKKPILLYIIIVILIIIIIVLSILLGIEINKKKCKEESINPINEKILFQSPKVFILTILKMEHILTMDVIIIWIPNIIKY